MRENLKGTLSGQLVRGYSAYAIAIQNGFEGTEKNGWNPSKEGVQAPGSHPWTIQRLP